MSTLNENAILAAEYARCGIKVFPCRESNTARGKSKAPYISKGYHGASAEYAQWRDWTSMHPTAIYGLPCAPNNLYVLDADRHGDGDGVQSLMTMFAHFAFDWRTVPLVRTPRNGLHVLFSRPANLGQTKGTLARAIDARDNAYIIAPGTALPDGRRYELIGGTTLQLARAIAEQTLPPMPCWLVSLAARETKAPKAVPNSVRPEGKARQIEGLIATVREAAVGKRNAALYWASCRAGEFINPHNGHEALARRLAEAGVSAGLDYREARSTVSSGMRAGRGGSTSW